MSWSRKSVSKTRATVGGGMAWLGLIVVAALIWWASWAELEEVTPGIGKVIPSKSVQLIQSLEGGILEKIHVAEGDEVEEGQKATVKFTAYDFAVYRGLEGTVEQLSVDTITDKEGETFYQIKVRTASKSLGKNRDGDDLPIMPGMVTEVDVMTGKKTVLAYLLRPVLRAKERSAEIASFR